MSSEEGKLWTQLNVNSQNKRKTEESPVLKQAKKIVKGDPDMKKAGVGGLDLSNLSEDLKV